MKTGYWISEDAFDTLVRAHSALNMLATLLYETENSKAALQAVDMAALVSFPTDGLKEVIGDAAFSSDKIRA